MSIASNKVLEDTKDLIKTIHDKGNELRNNPIFYAKWQMKNKRLQEEAKKLTPEEIKEMDKEFSEWMQNQFSELRSERKSE